MKIELNYIAGYLPYGLKAILSKEGVFNLDSEYPCEHKYKLCTITDFTTYSKDLGGSMKVDDTENYSFDFDSLDEINIVLRPLYDLKNDTYDFIYNQNYDYPSIEDWINLDVESRMSCKFSYDFWQLLYEHKFDIHGLIENNLAIDINTLK